MARKADSPKALLRGLALAVLCATVASVAGCASSEPEVVALETRSGAPLDTGRYPNLNIRREAAAPQFTDAERDAKIASLRAKGARLAAGGRAPSGSSAELARLARNRGEDVLKEIEAR